MRIAALHAFLAVFALHVGCTIHIADPVDVPHLAAYQKLTPGTPVVVVLRVGVRIECVEVDSPEMTIEQEGTLGWIMKDTVSIIIEREGKSVRVNYAGRMVREIRVKKEPKAPTTTSVTSSDTQETRQL